MLELIWMCREEFLDQSDIINGSHLRVHKHDVLNISLFSFKHFEVASIHEIAKLAILESLSRKNIIFAIDLWLLIFYTVGIDFNLLEKLVSAGKLLHFVQLNFVTDWDILLSTVSFQTHSVDSLFERASFTFK